MNPLYDVDAERALAGGLVVWPSEVGSVADLLISADFGTPSCAAVFTAVAELHRGGARIDWVTVADQLRRDGSGVEALQLLEIQSAGERPSPRHVEIIAGCSLRRRLAAQAGELAEAVRDASRDPVEVLDATRAAFAAIDSPILATDPGDLDVDAYLEHPVAEHSRSTVPPLICQDWRVILTAAEGDGKSTLLRQLSMCAAYGVQPFTQTPIEPVAALIVDLENPADVIHGALDSLRSHLRLSSKVDRAPVALWHRPGGIDLRRRADRLAFEDVLRRRRPELVTLGPLYKAYSRKASESDEQVASEVQSVLDDLRTRFAFALIAEHHAPKAQQGHRDLAPFGSSLWLRWPELGIKLVPSRDKPKVLRVERWRGDRAKATWPDELHRGSVLPFDGWYRDGFEGTGEAPI